MVAVLAFERPYKKGEDREIDDIPKVIESILFSLFSSISKKVGLGLTVL